MNNTQSYGRPSSMASVLLKFTLAISLVMILILLDKSISSQTNIPPVFHQAFRFHVHCPIQSNHDASFLYLMNYLNITDTYTKNKIFKQLIQQTTYVVFVEASPAYANDSTNSSVLLAYCGNARLKNETDCSNAKLMCTVPGPMFEAYVHQSIRVIWINDVNPEGLDWTQADENCYGNNSKSLHCTVGRKVDGVSQDCTFLKVTNMSSLGITKTRINSSGVPISPHVHGIETRPAFDGNPLTWFNNIGQKGPGYFSLSTNKYFSSFFPEGKTFLEGLLSAAQASKIKVSEYRHEQPPGMLFYHDHAMAVTLTNYVRGSLGFYMIYDPQQEKVFPQHQEDYIFAFHFFNQGDLRDNTDRKYMGGNQYPYVGPIQDNTFLYGSEYVYRNMTYRWRFLNAHFDTTYINISLAVFYEELQDEKGYYFINETEPPLNVDPETFKANMHELTFTVVGTDSAMFSNAVHGVKHFNLAVAERIQILIKYDQVPANVTKIYVVCYDVRDQQQKYTLKLELILLNLTLQNKYRQPEQYTELNVSFTNLRNVPSQQIVAKRMRALFSRPEESIFTINQHYQFSEARAENPKIGTIEDWYIINTMSQLHPIHFHLVNFQVVQTYQLKVSKGGCSFYELDFFRQSNISMFQIEDNDQLCQFLTNMQLDQMLSCIDQFNNYVLEDEFVNGISGKDVMEKITSQTNATLYEAPECPLGKQYKYICKNTIDILPVYQYGWKDTAGVSGLSVYVLRIRWTKTLFDPYLENDTYFAEDESNMIEFPGIVYHCHMLIHADKKMMRPIELQPSDRFVANHSLQNYQCNLDSWQQRYQCINQALNCPF